MAVALSISIPGSGRQLDKLSSQGLGTPKRRAASFHACWSTLRAKRRSWRGSSSCCSTGDENNGNIGKVAFGGRDGSFFHWSSGYSQTTVTDGQWHCIVGVAGNGSWDVYVDGTLASSQAGSTNNMSTEATVPFSSGWSAYSFYPLWFNGDIDNVRVYNRALTAYEVECFSVIDTTITLGDIQLHNADIRLFPNPTTGHLILEFTGETPKSGTLQLLDLYGRTVRKETLQPGKRTHNCSITNLPAGVYFAKVMDGGEPVLVEKIVKQ